MITGIKFTETQSPRRTFYTFEGLTPRGERLQVEFSAHINDGSRHDLCQVWYKRLVLDFDWMLPATPANRHKILAEIIRRANKEA